MSSIGLPLLALIVTRVAPLGAVESEPTFETLQEIDAALAAVGTLLAVAAGLWFAAYKRRDPLSFAPVRHNTFSEQAVALPVVAYCAAAIVMSGLGWAVGYAEDDMALNTLVSNAAQIGGAIACVLVARAWFVGGAGAFCFGGGEGSARHTAWIIVAMAVVGIGLCPLVQTLTHWITLRIAPAYEFEPHATLEALRGGTQSLWLTVALWGGATVVAPIAEELFFRGVLQTVLLRVFTRRWIAIAVSAVLFGLVHLPQPDSVPALILLAVLLGYAYERTGSLVAPILIHALFNIKNLVWTTIGAG